MELESSYDLLGVFRDDGIRTYRAVEKASGQEMQVHLFAKPSEPDRSLFRALRALPVSKRRDLLEMGMEGDLPYIVTEKLPDGSNARDWLTKMAGVTPKPAGPAFIAGSWKTGTPIPDELVRAAHSSAPPVLPPPKKDIDLSPDYTRVMRVQPALSEMPPVAEPPKLEAVAPVEVSLKPQPAFAAPPPPPPPPPPALPPEPPAVAVQPPPVAAPPPAVIAQPPVEELDEFSRLFGAAAAETSKEPGEFTKMFLAAKPSGSPAAPPAAPPAATPAASPAPAANDPGEFTRQFLATQPPQAPQPVLAAQSTSQFLDPAPPAATPPGEFTSKFLAPQAPVPPAAPPPPPPPARAEAPPAAPPLADPASADAPTRLFQAMTPEARQPDELSQKPAAPGGAPSKDGPSEFTRFFQSPMYPTPAGNQKMPSSTPMPMPQPASRSSSQPGEFTQMFGNPNKPAAAPPPPLGSGNANLGGSSATGVFSTPKPAAPRGSMMGSMMGSGMSSGLSSGLSSGPGEFTKMMAASSAPTLGQPTIVPAAAAAPAPKAKSNLLLYVAGGCVLLAIILVVVFFAMR